MILIEVWQTSVSELGRIKQVENHVTSGPEFPINTRYLEPIHPQCTHRKACDCSKKDGGKKYSWV